MTIYMTGGTRENVVQYVFLCVCVVRTNVGAVNHGVGLVLRRPYKAQGRGRLLEVQLLHCLLQVVDAELKEGPAHRVGARLRLGGGGGMTHGRAAPVVASASPAAVRLVAGPARRRGRGGARKAPAATGRGGGGGEGDDTATDNTGGRGGQGLVPDRTAPHPAGQAATNGHHFLLVSLRVGGGVGGE